MLYLKQIDCPVGLRYFGKRDCEEGKRSDLRIRIEGETPHQIRLAENILNEVIMGKVITVSNDNRLKYLKTEDGKKLLQQIEKEYFICLDYYPKLNRLKFYGDSKKFKSVENAFKNLLNQYFTLSERLSIKNRVIRPLLEDKKLLWQNLSKKYYDLNIELSVAFKEIRAQGKEIRVNEFLNEIKDILKLQEKEDENEKKCKICFGEIVKGYRLLACSHRFCHDCLSELISNALNELSIFPIQCPICQSHLALCDIKNLTEMQKKLFEKAFSKYLSNFKKYNYLNKNYIIFLLSPLFYRINN